MTRQICFVIALALLAAIWCSGRAPQEEFVVIVNPSNHFDALSRSKLSFLFFRKVSRWPWGAEAQPIELEPRSPARHWFVVQVMQTTEEQLSDYWIDQTATRGLSRPIRVADAAAAKKIVAARPGAVAYIPSSELDGTVKAIRVEP